MPDCLTKEERDRKLVQIAHSYTDLTEADIQILLDVSGRQNGRGAYICRSAECLKNACDRKGLERSLKTGISKEIKENLLKEMEALVEK